MEAFIFFLLVVAVCNYLGIQCNMVASCNQIQNSSPAGDKPMKHKNLEHDNCPIARSLEVVGDAWSMLVVRDAFIGKRRFGEFQRSLGVAKNILTVRLRKLVARGILEQVPATDGSAFYEYVLTEKGRGLFLVLVALGQWGCGVSEFRLVDRKNNHPIRLELRSESGRKVGLDEVLLVTTS
jgi:DNA-binding HxlR family transcriptional regulator